MPRISSTDFSRVIGEELTDIAKKFVEDSNLEFEELSKDEFDSIVKKISDEIN